MLELLDVYKHNKRIIGKTIIVECSETCVKHYLMMNVKEAMMRIKKFCGNINLTYSIARYTHLSAP